MSSFRKFISTGVSELRGLRPTSDPADVPVVKKKLCRLSNGHQGEEKLRKFNGTGGEPTDGNERIRSRTSDPVHDGCRFLDIAVVAKVVRPDDIIDAKTSSEVLRSRAEREEGADGSSVVWKNSVMSDDDGQTSTFGRRRGKCVAFCDDIVVHSFDDDLEDNNSDLNSSENASEIDDDSSTAQNDIDSSIDVRRWNAVDATPAVANPRKIPLRRLVFGRINHAYNGNKAGVFRTLQTRESARRPGLAPKTTVTRTKSLVDNSVRHSLVKVDDDDDGQSGGTGGGCGGVQLVLPLGPFCAPRDVSVTASGDGRKIKVLLLRESAAAAKRATDDDSLPAGADRRRDYSECFYLPKAVNPLRTKATVDNEGILRISAPFASDFPVRTLSTSSSR